MLLLTRSASSSPDPRVSISRSARRSSSESSIPRFVTAPSGSALNSSRKSGSSVSRDSSSSPAVPIVASLKRSDRSLQAHIGPRHALADTFGELLAGPARVEVAERLPFVVRKLDPALRHSALRIGSEFLAEVRILGEPRQQ